MKFRKDEWEVSTLGEAVKELRETSGNPIEDGYEKYVGFEHIEPDNLHLSEFGNLNDGVSFQKIFRKDDILFGKIRAYLRKVAIAPIDGICSGDILVLRTIDENKLSQKLLPYYITTESFLKRAVDSSIGTTLPRTKWQHINKHRISVPPLEEQKQIAVLFQSIETAVEEVEEQKQQLKKIRKLLANKMSDGDLNFSSKVLINRLKVKVGDVSYWYQKDIPNDKQTEYGIENYLTADHIDADEPIICKHGKLTDGKKGPTISKHFRNGDLLLSTRSVALHKAAVAQVDGVTGEKLIVIDVMNDSKILKSLLPFILHSDKFWTYAKNTASGSVNKFSSWNKIKEYGFLLLTKEEQQKILNVFEHIQTTLQQLRQQKQTLKILKQQLLNEILG